MQPLQGLTALATIMNCLTRQPVPYVALCGNSSEWLATKDHKELKDNAFVLYAWLMSLRSVLLWQKNSEPWRTLRPLREAIEMYLCFLCGLL